jgi:hypothetical protein
MSVKNSLHKFERTVSPTLTFASNKDRKEVFDFDFFMYF